jgi:Mg-chelatase subunit ChlD
MSQIYCVLDCSGSMKQYVERTISGLNEFVQSSAKDSVLSLLLFSDTVKVVSENIKISDVKPLTSSLYRPHGATALLDGIGHAIELAEKFESKSWADEGSVIILIMTDGEENASIKYTKTQINKLITEKKLLGWNFIFMGANQDAIRTASEFNIREESSLTFDANNVKDAFRSASHAIDRSQNGGDLCFTQVERTKSCPTNY